ncbi:MAG: choice-of-anchor Q domain-containing protein [Anaerolineae bacterium]
MRANQQMQKMSLVSVILILFLSALILVTQPAAAVERVVTTTAESGPGSLPQVIADAQSGDTITFDLTYPAEILIDEPLDEILIDKDLTITGPGADLLTVKTSNYPGGGSTRLFKIAAGASVTMTDMTFANASGYSSTGHPDGEGGAIYNAGSLALIRCTLTNNTGMEGGAIYNNGTLLLKQSLISDNFGGEDDSANDAYGGGLYNGTSGIAVIDHSTIEGNEPDPWFDPGGEHKLYGAGIYNGGHLELRHSTVESNYGYAGAGIYNSVQGVLTLTHSTVAHNYAELEMIDPDTWESTYMGYGGGISNFGDLLAFNSTVYFNAASEDGGGIYNGSGASLDLEQVTIGDNQASSSGGSGEGGGLWADGGVTLKNSVLADNEADTYPDCANGGAAFTSGDYNLIETLGNCNIVDAGHDRFGWAIFLAPHRFAANGGPTDTFAPYSTSVLVNSIPITVCTAMTDQRGVPRPQGGLCDIGAYEAATMGWDGEGGDGSWLNDANWTWDVRPGMGDVAALDNAMPVTITYDEGTETTSVGTINLTGGGVTLQQAAYVRLEHDYTQSAGAFKGDPNDEMALRAFYQNGGIFRAPGQMRLSGDFDHSDGTFDANGGELVFTFSPDQSISGDNTFYDLTIDKWAVGSTVDASGSTLTVTHQLSIAKGIFVSASAFHHVQIDTEGTLRLSEDVTVGGDWHHYGDVQLNGHAISFAGTGPQTLQATGNVSGTGNVPFLEYGHGDGMLIDAQGENLGEVTVTVKLNEECTTVAGDVFARCFDIETEHTPAGGATLTFFFYDDEIAAGESCSEANVYHWNGSAWETTTLDTGYGTGGRMCDAEPYSLRVENVADFSPFVLSEDMPTGDPAGAGYTIYLPLVMRS